MIPISQVGKLMFRAVKAVVALGPLCCAVSRIEAGAGSQGTSVACGIFPMTQLFPWESSTLLNMGNQRQGREN